MRRRNIPVSGNVSARPKGRDPPCRRVTELEASINRLKSEHSEDTLSLLVTILKNAPIGFAYLDNRLRYRLINERLACINGLTIEEHYGKTVTEVVPSFPKKSISHMKKVLKTGRPILDVEFSGTTLDHPHGEKFWKESFYPVRSAAGNILGIGAIVSDITKRKQHEKFREDFFRMASHEIKNPLTSIKAYSQIIKRNLKTKGDGENEKLAERIESNANKIHYLIKSLMDLTKTETGKMEFRREPVSLDEVIREVVRDNMQQSAKHRFVLDGRTGEILNIDRERIMQVIGNLISNAVKYSPKGGVVKVRIAKEQGSVVVAVTDEGVGIPKTKLRHIFEKYYRGQGENVSRDGLGLGLYISSRIIRHYRGKIWAQSTVGKGSTFFFSLPCVFRGRRVFL